MTPSLRLVLVLHNHQPVGNFDGVIEQAYQDSYLPFLDVFEQFRLPIALHTSGCLAEWLDRHHPEYLDRLAKLAKEGRVEIVGGAFYEPILAMIPPRDRVGQITRYSDWLHNRLGATIRGMWIPERVWEQTLTRDIVDAEIQYTILDDSHFKSAGLAADNLAGYYLTEDDTRLLRVFPGSERLRYLIPFADPQETITYLRELAERQPGAVVAFGDDGEKFGTWPDTKAHVYEQGWLRRFFEALEANSEWLHVCTPSTVIDQLQPLGKIYIPEGSYREMTEWSLPADRLVNLEDTHHELTAAGHWDRIAPFVRGGFWRNFKAKYPETDEMYARMQLVSRRLHDALQEAGPARGLLEQAQIELYRGQCNCSYWHGAFGGVYLPHLRQGVYEHLIAADNLLEQAQGRGWHTDERNWVELDSADYNLDGRQEVRLANDRLYLLTAPAAGGQIYELDVRPICLNLLATLDRRPEAYHRRVAGGAAGNDGDVSSIHDRVVFKQEGLDQRLQYDAQRRKSLLDHFYPLDTHASAVVAGHAPELGDFAGGVYEARLRRNPDRMQLQMSREGQVDQQPLRITKGITLSAGSDTLEIAYLIEGLPPEAQYRFAVELNFAGLPGGVADRYFHNGHGTRWGQLETQLDLVEERSLALVDEWLGIEVAFSVDRPTGFWTFPIETVNQSEAGFELVHQSVVVLPHWVVQGDQDGRWSVTFALRLDTSRAESRLADKPAAQHAQSQPVEA